MKRFMWAFLCALTTLLLNPKILRATTYAVGTCEPSLPKFSTISAAVAAVPAGSTVEICPGTYAEQVVIPKALTLIGITSGNTNRVIIKVPAVGLVANVTSIGGNSIAAQVLAETGPVDITNITVDGTTDIALPADVLEVGIFYESGSSGTVNEVTARHQSSGSAGSGIWAENGTSATRDVTIENCDIHDLSAVGIVVFTNQTPPTLKVTIDGNTVTGVSKDPVTGISNQGATGSIANNMVSNFSNFGIFDLGVTVSISGNTVTTYRENTNGIALEGTDETVKSNLVSNVLGSRPGIGIAIGPPSSGLTVEDNKIINSNIAIEFGCHSATVSGNTITDASTALDEVPTSLTSTNTYYGVNAIRTACSSSAATAKPALAAGLSQKVGS